MNTVLELWVSTNETNFETTWWATGLSRITMLHEYSVSQSVSQPASRSGSHSVSHRLFESNDKMVMFKEFELFEGEVNLARNQSEGLVKTTKNHSRKVDTLAQNCKRHPPPPPRPDTTSTNFLGTNNSTLLSHRCIHYKGSTTLQQAHPVLMWAQSNSPKLKQNSAPRGRHREPK